MALAQLDLRPARALGRDSGPVFMVAYPRVVRPDGRRPFRTTHHYAPPCLVRLVRQVLAHLELDWRRVEAVAGDSERVVVLRQTGGDAAPLATLSLISDHDPQAAFRLDPFSVEGVADAIRAVRFGGPGGWSANPNHFAASKGAD